MTQTINFCDCTIVSCSYLPQILKIHSMMRRLGLNHICELKKPLSGISTIRTVLASTVHIVVVVVVVSGGFYVSP